MGPFSLFVILSLLLSSALLIVQGQVQASWKVTKFWGLIFTETIVGSSFFSIRGFLEKAERAGSTV